MADRASQFRDNLGNTAGLDPLQDRFQTGYIQACQDVVGIDFEDAKND